MCTIGAIAKKDLSGQVHGFLTKNCDARRGLAITHEIRGGLGCRYLTFALDPQGGVNAGMNEFGLGVAISYSDYRLRDPEAASLGAAPSFARVADEPRTAMNECVLERCRTVPEAIEFMASFVERNTGMVGGNHLLVDALGNLAAFEHCEGRSAVARHGDRGYVGRANNSLLLIEDKQRHLAALRDSRERQERIDRFLASGVPVLAAGRRQELIRMAKKAMSEHADEGCDRAGSVCVHGLEAPGSRSPAAGPHATDPQWKLSSLIFDVSRREMQYTLGTPCNSSWIVLSL